MKDWKRKSSALAILDAKRIMIVLIATMLEKVKILQKRLCAETYSELRIQSMFRVIRERDVIVQ